MTALTAQERKVLARVRRLCAARPEGWVEEEMAGGDRTVLRLVARGLVRRELHQIGPMDGRYFRLRVTA